MKSSFKSFVTPSSSETESAWSSDDTIFVFDTNVLLNLYGFEQQTREDFFSIASKLGQKIWIPFHVGLEYNKQRLTIIGREKKVFRTLNSVTEKLTTQLRLDLENLKLKDKFPEIHDLASALIEKIKSAAAEFSVAIEPWDKKQPDVRSEDLILNRIDEITSGKIGPPPPDQAWLDAIYEDGANRFDHKIPPGYKDASKENGGKIDPDFSHNRLIYKRQYGDLIIWKQILQHAELLSIKNIFFVTDDLKEDWWATVQSGGPKPLGPREELKREAYNLPTVELFHMYTTSDFLSSGQKILDVHVRESSISDAIPHIETSTGDDQLPLTSITDIRPWLERPYIDPNLYSDVIRQFTIPILTPQDYEQYLSKHGSGALPTDVKSLLSSLYTSPTDAWKSIILNYDSTKAHSVLDQFEESKKLAALRIQEVIDHNELMDKIRQMQDIKTMRSKKKDDDDEGEPA